LATISLACEEGHPGEQNPLSLDMLHITGHLPESWQLLEGTRPPPSGSGSAEGPGRGRGRGHSSDSAPPAPPCAASNFLAQLAEIQQVERDGGGSGSRTAGACASSAQPPLARGSLSNLMQVEGALVPVGHSEMLGAATDPTAAAPDHGKVVDAEAESDLEWNEQAMLDELAEALGDQAALLEAELQTQCGDAETEAASVDDLGQRLSGDLGQGGQEECAAPPCSHDAAPPAQHGQLPHQQDEFAVNPAGEVWSVLQDGRWGRKLGRIAERRA
jgi:hypothetical protein